MPTWIIPSKLSYALFVAGDARLGEDARPALNRVLASLADGPPPAVELRSWIVEHGRMGTIGIEAFRAQTAAFGASEAPAADEFADATHAMIVAAGEGAALDARAPWGLLVLAATMASACAGSVFDSGTLRTIPRWILENPLDGFLLGSIKNHVTILRSTDAGGRQTTTTLGLNKYGLFELELSDVADGARRIGMLVAGLTQAIVDARPATPGLWDVPASFDVTRLHVAHAFGTELEGAGGRTQLAIESVGPDSVYWRVGIPHGVLDSQAVDAAIRALGITHDDDEAVSAALTQATRIARNRLSEARDAFARRSLTNDVVLVKKGFASDGAGTEYLWLRVEDWSRGGLAAIATSATRDATGVGLGDRIVLADNDIVDWRVERQNGEAIGNFSAEALRRIGDA